MSDKIKLSENYLCIILTIKKSISGGKTDENDIYHFDVNCFDFYIFRRMSTTSFL
ncbi:MAG: hypothetical protein PWQ77_2142 [Kosmotogales bacterium]|nr:hypothetical protein [Kosmotogales bacterium]